MKVWVLRLRLSEGTILMKIARDNRDDHTTQVVLLSEKSPSTALATGRFGLGVDTAFAAVL